ncbi:hypothetical protein P8452_57059 [Trifolium repens]|nr:hypothetical protein P8452_57059 [Trifolium repens]
MEALILVGNEAGNLVLLDGDFSFLVLFALCFQRTTSTVSTSVVATPKLPSEITGKTLEEMLRKLSK